MPDENEAIIKPYGFPSYPGLTYLCQQRVYIAGSLPQHLTWDAFASESSPSTLIEYYRLKLGEAGFSKEKKGGTWRLPPDAPRPSRVLDIYSVGEDGPHTQCDKKPPPGSRSILIFSIGP